MAKGNTKKGGGGSTGLKGNRKDNLLTGTDGDDIMRGGGGDDTLNAGLGNDFLNGETGNDSLNGEAGHDRLFGGGGNDFLAGGIGDDDLTGGTGNDEMLGGDGNDLLIGGFGSDTIDGGIGDHDVVSFVDVSAYFESPYDAEIVEVDGVTVTSAGAGSYLAHTEIAAGVFETDYISNVWKVVGSNFNDAMTGGAGDDHFEGALGHDVIGGGAGNDTIYGGLDNDTLSGGAGDDTFIFLRVADGRVEPNPPVPGDMTNYDDAGYGDGADVITDFNTAFDTILFLTNEDMTVGSYLNGDGFTVLTYAAPDSFGPSEITLFGVTDTADQLLLNGTIEIMVDEDFSFMV